MSSAHRRKVSTIAERGAPPADARCRARDADAPFVMDLERLDHQRRAMALLAPQWADPKKWWKQLCQSEGKKDYDWAHLARRYFPARVDEKCKKDPSLAVAHGCFWKYHPQKAYAWELRLKHEIRPEFTIDEEGSDKSRALCQYPRRRRRAAEAKKTPLGQGPASSATMTAREPLSRKREAATTTTDVRQDDAAPVTGLRQTASKHVDPQWPLTPPSSCRTSRPA